MKNNFYISTTIPYVNAKPHIGHALEYVQTDAIARYQRLQGKNVFFLSGTDENSLKNVQAAEKAGKEVKDFVDEHYKYFYNFKDILNISFDDFIRTTEDRHFKGAQKLWQNFKPEDLEKKKYQGLYCIGCESFLKEDELVDGKCPDHKTEPEQIEEENWFFKLSNYQDKLKELVESGELNIIPIAKKNEWLAFIDRGLEDFSISRSKERAHGWGVPVPNDESQIMYVWVDALSNYINALNYGGDEKLFNEFWNKDSEIIHCLGKGVGKFHVLYWPAILLSAGLDLPTQEFIHGYLTNEGEKISKSLGNVVDPYEVVEKYGTDAVRYFLLGGIPAFQDGDFSYKRFEEFYTAHLVNGVGNLTSRVLTMLEKYSEGLVPEANEDPNIIGSGYKSIEGEFELQRKLGFELFWEIHNKTFQNYHFDALINIVNATVSSFDDLITKKEPWKKHKEGEDISGFLYQLAEGLRHIGLALLPIIPETARKILNSLGIKDIENIILEKEKEWGRLEPGTKITKPDILFPRLEKKK